MKIGILGGSFDPPHFGHILPALYILEKKIVNKIIVIPNKKQPLKQNTLDFQTRYQLVKIAFEKYENISVSDIEYHLPEPSYTINTLKELKKQMNDDLFLIIGYDEANQIDKWYKYEELKKHITFIIIKRNCNDRMLQKKFFNNAIFVDNPVFEISSTKIREYIKKNNNLYGLLPENIIREIKRRKLYIE